MSEDINKAESSAATVTRPITAEKGQPRIVTSGNFIQDQKQTDLKMPRRLCTYDSMTEDDAVYNSIDVTNLLVLTALQNGEFTSPSGSQSSKVATEFLNYCIRNMDSGTWLQAMNNAVTDLKYGFSLANIVVKKRNYGPYKGSFVLSKMAPRDQKSLYGWVWDKQLREVKGFVQKPMLLQSREPKMGDFKNGLTLNNIRSFSTNYPFISSQQALHFIYDPKNNNPQGDSPLNHCYDAWMEKKLVERYEVVGISKDLGGAVVLRVPASLIERANDPVNYPNEAAEYQQLQRDAGALHAGESSYIVLTSDVDPATNNKLFDFELKGIDGGGKQYKTSEVVDQKRKSIYNVFGTSHLLLGQGSVGSNALSTNQMSVHDQYVNRNLLFKTDVLNNQLAPRLLAVNNIFLSHKDMPVFRPGDPTKPDFETISKFIQRTKSVGGLTPSALEELYKIVDLPTEGIEDLVFDDGDSSRGGESGGTSGIGNTQAGTGDGNMENKSLIQDLIDDGGTLINKETGKEVSIDDLT